MSPSEDQLRAALHDGEPAGTGGLSADRLIAQASEIRHRRRVRYGSVLGGVAAAAAVGALLTTVTTTHSEKSASGGAAQARPQVAGDAAGGTGGSAGSLSGANCPASAPNVPIGAGHGSFFTGPVASMRLCVYAPTGGAPLEKADGQVLTTTLTGRAALQLAASLDAAATKPTAEPCPLFRTADAKILAIIPVGADGTTMAPITVPVLDNPCNRPVSNGTTVRYNWTPPSSVTPYLHEAATVPASGARPLPATSSPVEHGSPIST